MDTQSWLMKAKQEIEKLPIGKEFELRNLFYEIEWEGLSKGDRIRFGIHFKNEVLDGKILGIKYVDRKKNNHAKYIKIKESHL